jgi:hypothetical protein
MTRIDTNFYMRFILLKKSWLGRFALAKMKFLRIFSLVSAIALLFSALTGIQRMHYSSDTGGSVQMHSLSSRLITLVLGLVFAAWYWGLRLQKNWGKWITNILFFTAIFTCLWQGTMYAIFEKELYFRVGAVVSSIIYAILIYFLWRKTIPKKDNSKL